MQTWYYQELTQKIIGAAIEVHKNLGPGLLEMAYHTCLATELETMKLHYQREMPVPIMYKNKKLDCGFRADFLVENTVVLELKSVESLSPIHESQILTYLRFMDKPVGLLLNFNELVLKNGIRRFVLGKSAESTSLPSGQGPV